MYAERAVKLLKQMRDNCVPKETDAYNDPLRKDKHEALNMAIAQLSGHNGQPARWKSVPHVQRSLLFMCSNCGTHSHFKTNYCCDCGARMDKEKTGD